MHAVLELTEHSLRLVIGLTSLEPRSLARLTRKLQSFSATPLSQEVVVPQTLPEMFMALLLGSTLMRATLVSRVTSHATVSQSQFFTNAMKISSATTSPSFSSKMLSNSLI